MAMVATTPVLFDVNAVSLNPAIGVGGVVIIELPPPPPHPATEKAHTMPTVNEANA
jgi:hypothetical protein